MYVKKNRKNRREMKQVSILLPAAGKKYLREEQIKIFN
jgi:hypothetical protein